MKAEFKKLPGEGFEVWYKWIRIGEVVGAEGPGIHFVSNYLTKASALAHAHRPTLACPPIKDLMRNAIAVEKR